MDNGPEFIAQLTQEWGKIMGIKILYIQPEKPTQNSFAMRKDMAQLMKCSKLQVAKI